MIRHGQSKANQEGTVAGSLDDSPLTQIGEQEAIHAAENLKLLLGERGITISQIISSPLLRARKTAEIISRDALDGAPISTDGRLTERNLGKATGMKRGTWHALLDDPTAGIETDAHFVERVGEVFDELQSSVKNIVVVSHNGVKRALQTYIEHGSPEKFHEAQGLGNGEIYIVPDKGEENG